MKNEWPRFSTANLFGLKYTGFDIDVNLTLEMRGEWLKGERQAI
jgi:hypothetical protein